jgi:hypothetical protein
MLVAWKESVINKSIFLQVITYVEALVTVSNTL